MRKISAAAFALVTFVAAGASAKVVRPLTYHGTLATHGSSGHDVTEIVTDEGQHWDLDFGGDRELTASAAKLEGKHVALTGYLVLRDHDHRVVVVASVKDSPKKP